MSQSAHQPPLLEMPSQPGRLVLENCCLMAARLLDRQKFQKFCRERNLNVSTERLKTLERLELFKPIIRFRAIDNSQERLRLPSANVSKWFEDGRLVDTASLQNNFLDRPVTDDKSEAYYSIFQVDDLSLVLNQMTLNVNLENYLDGSSDFTKSTEQIEGYIAQLRESVENKQARQFRAAIPVLCQFISNRYYPHTQGNQRTIRIPGGHSTDPWMTINGLEWDWQTYARQFNPQEVESIFSLSPAILQHAYNALATRASFLDPLDDWANLVEFISVQKRKKLKGDALCAQTIRDAANMLRLLHKDLYDETLPPTHEVSGTVITHFPELDVRKDTRQHLEYVINQYDLNPQPKLVLFVEGESEVRLINYIFENYNGAHPGRHGIELVNLQGVNNATGSKKADRFRAIFRLVDYLHHHQTMTFLLLDRENNAQKLKEAARDSRSLHNQARLAVQNRHIHLWKINLEFDNFSDTEMASAMTTLVKDKTKFTQADLRSARYSNNPGKAISNLYRNRTGHDLDKPALAERLAGAILAPNSRRKPENRPIVKVLDKVVRIAARNPFPTRQETWSNNQMSPLLGGKPRNK